MDHKEFNKNYYNAFQMKNEKKNDLIAKPFALFNFVSQSCARVLLTFEILILFSNLLYFILINSPWPSKLTHQQANILHYFPHMHYLTIYKLT